MKHPPWLLAPEGSLVEGGTVSLDVSEARHAAAALRLGAGDPVVLTDGAGAVAEGALAVLRRGAAEVVVAGVRHQPRSVAGLTLAMSVLAGTAMDLVVQKAVELGVERLLPVCSDRSQLGPGRASERIDHWLRVSRQALKQCHRAWAMEVAAPLALGELVDGPLAAGGVVAHPEGKPAEKLPAGRTRLLLVGPEGGFTEVEERALAAAGWPRVGLGPYVLRAETAAIAGVVLLSSRLAKLRA